MLPRQNLLLLILHILYNTCHSICLYEETYILWNNTNYPDVSGFYLKTPQIEGNYFLEPDKFQPICGQPTPVYNGTYIYYLPDSNPTLYLYQFHSADGKSGLEISQGICGSGHIIATTNKAVTGAILNGSNCNWAELDSDNPQGPILWYAGGYLDSQLSGETVLCDTNEGCNTAAPTTSPTLSPIPTTAAPSGSPTTGAPTMTPTVPSQPPSKYPTKHPTVKPTDLPTFPEVIYDQPPCVAMLVTNLGGKPNTSFPNQAAFEEQFNEVKNRTYNGHRIWTNGAKLEIFFTKRYDPPRWIISNGTYHMINDIDYLLNDSVAYSLPGAPDGHALYDHFPNENPVGLPDSKITIRIACTASGTRHPTRRPTFSPSLSPTTPPSLAPSITPTENSLTVCNTLHMVSGATDCANIAGVVTANDYLYAKLGYLYNNHSIWGLLENSNWQVYYSTFHDAWVVNFKQADDFQGLVNTETGKFSTSKTPPEISFWQYLKHSALFTPPCNIQFTVKCSAQIFSINYRASDKPSPAPSGAPSMLPTTPPSASPTQPPTAAPTQPPSVAPTSAPTLLCGGLTLDIESSITDANYDFFRGDYRREEPTAGVGDGIHYWWQSRDYAGAKIFYSDILFHKSWVVESYDAKAYWLLTTYHSLLHVLQPPLFDSWEYFTGESVFLRDRANISFNCSNALLPTRPPSAAPSYSPTQPPSLAPSIAPSVAPSTAPSIAPSLTPTNHPTTPAPTMSPTATPSAPPTSAPTREACDFMQVFAAAIELVEFNGLYERMSNGSHGWPAWNTSNEYGSYVIEKKATGNYWAIQDITNLSIADIYELSMDDLVSMDNSYNWRPPVYGSWQFWQTRPNPTRAPTTPPTAAPSSETSAPTAAPSIAPTAIPTTDPTLEPTESPSPAPTGDPTSEPTFEPTVTPTYLPTMEPTVEPTHQPTFEPTVETRRRSLLQDPPQGTQVFGAEFKIAMDCVNSGAPTMDPTTADPTAAPTSQCEALSISGTDNASYFGEYIRAPYEINGYPWFLSYDGAYSLQFSDGLWTIFRRDRDDGLNDEDPLLIFRGETRPTTLKWLLASPRDLPWYALYDKAERILHLDCSGSVPPTPAPSVAPTVAPTAEMAPVWIECKQNWFTFVTAEQYSEIGNASYGVYWEVPTAVGQDTGAVTVDIVWERTSEELIENATSGELMLEGEPNSVDIGVYSILYRATNAYHRNESEPQWSECQILLYVIGDSVLDTSDYCYDQKFAVEVVFNESYFEIQDWKDSDSDESNEIFKNKYTQKDSVAYDASLMVEIEGYATTNELRMFGENCYIYAKAVINATEAIAIEEDKSTYLGIEASAVVWDTLILLVLLCLLCLCCFRIHFYYSKYKRNKEASDSSKEALLEQERVLSADNDDFMLGAVNPQTQPTRNSANSSTTHSDKGLLSHSGKKVHQPGSLSGDGDVVPVGRQGTTNANTAIDALIGDAFDGSQPGTGGGNVEMQRINKKKSDFDAGGDLPYDNDDHVLVTPFESNGGVGMPPPAPVLVTPQHMDHVPDDEDDFDSEFDEDSEFEFRV